VFGVGGGLRYPSTVWWNFAAPNVRLLFLRHNTKTLASELLGSLLGRFC